MCFPRSSFLFVNRLAADRLHLAALATLCDLAAALGLLYVPGSVYFARADLVTDSGDDSRDVREKLGHFVK